MNVTKIITYPSMDFHIVLVDREFSGALERVSTEAQCKVLSLFKLKEIVKAARALTKHIEPQIF